MAEFDNPEFNLNDDENNIIELLSCPRGGESCSDQRINMNNQLTLARQYIKAKEYSLASYSLSKAFESTFELQKNTCLKCAELFRKHILQSQQEIIKELKYLTGGIFKRKKYLDDYKFASGLFETMKKNI